MLLIRFPKWAECKEKIDDVPKQKLKPALPSRQDIANAIDAVTEGERDQRLVITKIADRLKRVGLTTPGIEVRWSNLKVDVPTPAPKRGKGAPPVSASSSSGLCKTPPRTTILDAGSGLLTPGRMTLLLGPPGSGRSLLLRALAGQLLAQNPFDPRLGREKDKAYRGGAGGLHLYGEVYYNGVPTSGKDLQIPRTATYISQTENHLAELTVRETLEFAAACQGTGMLRDLYKEMTKREKEAGMEPDDVELDKLMSLTQAKGPHAARAIVENMARLLAIDHVMDTFVGNDMLKGISGGQKRRVTYGEMAVGMQRVLMADEITNGLDAASALAIAKALRNVTKIMNTTFLISLLQPSPELVACFDDVILMAAGIIVYHGPVEALQPFLGSLGLQPAPEQNLADFVQEVVASPADQSRYRTQALPVGCNAWISPRRMRQAFLQSSVGKAAQEALAAPPYTHPLQDLVITRQPFGVSRTYMFTLALGREVILLKRNMDFSNAGLGQILFTAFLVSTAFVNLSHDSANDANLFLGVCFFSIMSIFMVGFNFAPIFVSRLAVFYKQRDHRFLTPSAFMASCIIMRLPDLFIQSVGYCIMVYFSVGFTLDAGRFFLFWSLIFAAGLNSIITFQLLGSICRQATITQGLGAVYLMINVIISGLPIAPTSIPPWWIWFYWISPMAWIFRAMAANELGSPAWAPASPAPGAPTIGQAVLELRGIKGEEGWVYGGLGYAIGFSVIQLFFLAICLAFLGPLSNKTPGYGDDDEEGRARSIQFAHLPEMLDGVESQGGASGDGDGDGEGQANPAYQGKAAAAPAAGAVAIVAAAGAVPVVEAPAATAAVPGSGPVAEATEGDREEAAAVISMRPTSADAADLDGKGEGEEGRELPFTHVTFAFKNISYFVPNPQHKKGKADSGPPELQLLNHVSGVFRPGVLTALMGASGAGKTTLMDVLAGRKTGGRVEGEQVVNGVTKEPHAFARLMGYVEQFDVHSPHATVEEALLFSANLRVTAAQLREAGGAQAFVRRMMKVVELEPLAHRTIGLGGASGGLSVEVRKRLTIACELVANPGIVFMDEPTSGLDARAAGVVMRAVRNTVEDGRTVVCTIHQPNREIMDAFDELLLLKPGGRTIFFGPLGKRQAHLVEHFSAYQGVPLYDPAMNPANWMLDATSAASAEAVGADFADLWAESAEAKVAMDLVDRSLQPRAAGDIEEGSAGGGGGGEAGGGGMYAQPLGRQLQLVLGRSLQMQTRDLAYNGVRFGIAFAMGWILGSLYWGLGDKYETELDLYNTIGCLFCSMLFLPVTNMLTVMPQIEVQRAVFYREKASGMYAPWIFAAAQILAEFPFLIGQIILYVGILYPTVHFMFDGPKFGWFLLYSILDVTAFTYMGMGAINLSKNMPSAIAGASLLLMLWNLFCGFLIPRPEMKDWYIWAYYCNPLMWIIQGVTVTQLGDLNDSYVMTDAGPVAVPEFLDQAFAYDFGMRGWIILILIGFLLTFCAATFFGVMRLNFQMR
ncbi:hypothetical protein HYH03_010072 [Edaphochlamys debaryana]|uniref:ABC transporter domain-containing protein n=1 Tax=Edaphochlamys debaryana TaxID=47281 RepID=A0A835XWH1_9CHLO|nr:hypothetical protein HYH03_010072 [Edaphochlamys debaryana]|eukprot:KAG2491493.1 hypothetical protein HYH03_010072 [Edaphochlamys debaryana]